MHSPSPTSSSFRNSRSSLSSSSSSLSRRSFLKTSALVLAGATLSARSWAQVAGANSAVRVGVAGLNGRGKDLLSTFRKLEGVRIAALCDVDTAVLDKVAHSAHEAGDTDVRKFVDFREMIARDDIDAVVIATPNHLHSLLAIWAIQAGKDVYVEKPVSHNVWEGRQLAAAAAKHQRIVQAGMQCRSSHSLAEAIAWLREGNLGKITAARGLCYKRRKSIGLAGGPQPVPETVNYDLWLGPAPKAPPHRERFHYDWHWQYPYGNGDLGNQGVHQVDIARWFLGEAEIAPRVLSVGGRFGYKDDGETPNTQLIVHDYARAPLIFEVRGLPARGEKAGAATTKSDSGVPSLATSDPAAEGAGVMDEYRGASIGVVVHCEGGYIVVPDYTSAQAFDKDGKPLKQWKGSTSHYGNFIDCVRSRKAADLRGPALEGHISSALCHTPFVSHLLGKELGADALREQIKGNSAMSEAFGRMSEHLAANGVDLKKTPIVLGAPLTFDPKSERFNGMLADKANKMLTREYRAPFVVPKIA